MDIRQTITPRAQAIVDAINGARGWNIGTGLELYLNEKVNLITNGLGVGYAFQFNMGGRTSHIFYELKNHANTLTL